MNAEAARWFCEHHECPANWKDANEDNCCIHHANIHSCPLGYMVQLRLGVRGQGKTQRSRKRARSLTGTPGLSDSSGPLGRPRCGLSSLLMWFRLGLLVGTGDTHASADNNHLSDFGEHLRTVDSRRRKDLHAHHLYLGKDDPDQLDGQGAGVLFPGAAGTGPS